MNYMINDLHLVYIKDFVNNNLVLSIICGVGILALLCFLYIRTAEKTKCINKEMAWARWLPFGRFLYYSNSELRYISWIVIVLLALGYLTLFLWWISGAFLFFGYVLGHIVVKYSIERAKPIKI